MRPLPAESASLSVSSSGMTLTVISTSIESALRGLHALSSVTAAEVVLRVCARAYEKPGAPVLLGDGRSEAVPAAATAAIWDRTTPIVISSDCWAHVKSSDGAAVPVVAAAMALASLSRHESWR